MIARLLVRLVMLGAIFAGGCGGPPPPPTLAGADLPPPPAQVPEALDERLDGVETVRAGIEMVWSDPRFEEPESCRGSLSFVKPDSLRLRGVSAAFFTVFDLVAAGSSVWLDIPREGLAVFGARTDPAWARLPLSPRSLMIALLAHPCPGEACLREAESTRDSEGIRWTGNFGELLVDRITGLPIRYLSPEEDPVRISWLEWVDRSGTPWPRRFRVERAGGRSLDVSFGRVQVGRPVPSSRFRPQQDSSREILTPAEAARRWAAD